MWREATGEGQQSGWGERGDEGGPGPREQRARRSPRLRSAGAPGRAGEGPGLRGRGGLCRIRTKVRRAGPKLTGVGLTAPPKLSLATTDSVAEAPAMAATKAEATRDSWGAGRGRRRGRRREGGGRVRIDV